MAEIEHILTRFSGAKRDSLIPILEAIQDEQGFLSEEAIIQVSRFLKLPASKVFGVATFYDYFNFTNPARYRIKICHGTACHVMGSATVIQHLISELGIQPGKTTRDGLFSLELVSCMGACGSAPVMMVNDTYFANTTRDELKRIIDGCKRTKI
ncbi:MAG TPA: NAD(P)H-dependent oxidoreductase subunit E [Bacteroidales bacterium]|nr:NAD(P)H-dependent oxidoreductase subunit E [Bacteroidales bacterium]